MRFAKIANWSKASRNALLPLSPTKDDWLKTNLPLLNEGLPQ